MINVEVRKFIDGSIKSIDIIGHSGFDEEGKDLVCAGVSCVFIGGLNSISDLDNYLINLEKGFGKIEAKKEPNEHDKVVLETILVQLNTIETKYSKYIKVKVKKEGAK